MKSVRCCRDSVALGTCALFPIFHRCATVNSMRKFLINAEYQPNIWEQAFVGL